MPAFSGLRFYLLLAAALTSSGLAGPEELGSAPFYAGSFSTQPSAADLSLMGRRLFFDPTLSASGRTSCASCHDPKHAYAAPNDLPVQRAGLDGEQAGVRAVPSLKYAQNIPPFTLHFIDDEGDDSIDQGPAGGRTWDGRAQSAHDQARLPLYSPFEMANANSHAVLVKIEQGDYASEFRRVFGARVFDDDKLAFKAVLLALETFQQEPREFYPYSSKYDAYLRGKVSLTPQELRGLAVFNDPKRGNCARCHPSAMRAGAFPQFTDFGFAALGLPRNLKIPANRDPDYFDLGLCGPWRTDLAQHTEYCGMFRTPTLRNVATRAVFFHNGIFHRLEEAVRFYATRDSERAVSLDDLPKQFVENLDTQSPFDTVRGAKPKISEQEVRDVVVFLHALTDDAEIAPQKRSPILK